MGRIDDATSIAEAHPDMILTCFGDLMRLPGGRGSFLDSRARGADIRVVYSPLDALRLAVENPDRHVMFYAIGFETTAPSTALTLQRAKADGVTNFSVFCNHVTIIPAIKAILDSPDLRLDAFIGPGHVSTMIGNRADIDRRRRQQWREDWSEPGGDRDECLASGSTAWRSTPPATAAIPCGPDSSPKRAPTTCPMNSSPDTPDTVDPVHTVAASWTSTTVRRTASNEPPSNGAGGRRDGPWERRMARIVEMRVSRFEGFGCLYGCELCEGSSEGWSSAGIEDRRVARC